MFELISACATTVPRNLMHAFAPILNEMKNSYAENRGRITIPSMTKQNNAGAWAGIKLLTVPQVCEILQISQSTFYKWGNKKQAPKAMRLPNGSLRVQEEHLNTFIRKLAKAGRANA